MKLLVSSWPHIRDKITTRGIMLAVVIALLPATAFGVWSFGLQALLIVLTSVITAVATEFVAFKLMKQKPTWDGSAVVTGLLLALTLPPTLPLWTAAVGAVFSISIGKFAFGGLGRNIFNPALVGRAFLSISWPALMTTWVIPGTATTTATPLTGTTISNANLFIGNVAGSLGEVSKFAILIGGLYLIVMKYIDWRTPLFYIGTVGVLTLALGQDPIFHMLAGGLFLGAFFMATDYVTTPMTSRGRIIFAVGGGSLVVAIRLFGGLPEGVAYSILIMNAFTPLIERYTRPRVYGTGKVKK
ncbi:MAG: RnfABCDGE type electron transport complex subunit D [Candidatus Hadarchaeota archaeon]